MFPFSLFSSSSIKISDRLESLRDAESKLLEYAKTRFVHHQQHQGGGDHSLFELFDTPIQPPSVIEDKKKSDVLPSQCQVFDDAEHYSLHGVKVVNRQLSRSDGDNIMPALLAGGGANKNEKKQPAPLVLLHGYANGSLYFYRNLHGLSQFFGQIYALDMLGWGLSSRPKLSK